MDGQLTINGDNFLAVSELFFKTFQGEGRFMGHPAALLRLKGCGLRCNFCDSTESWNKGGKYSFEELFELMDDSGCIDYLKKGAHWVVTGGQPLLQQERLFSFFGYFRQRFDFLPFVELENECTIAIDFKLDEFIQQYNNSPKLENSGVEREVCYNVEAIKQFEALSIPSKKIDFKFVITKQTDWDEIERDFIEPKLIKRNQIILMPEGKTKEQLEENRLWVAELAMTKEVRYSDRLHILLYGNRKGV